MLYTMRKAATHILENLQAPMWEPSHIQSNLTETLTFDSNNSPFLIKTPSMKTKLLLLIASIVFTAIPVSQLFAQAGITAKPSRLYFSGASPKSQTITINNPSGKPLEVG